jgi:hypothetical protein
MADFQIGRTLKYCTYSNIGLWPNRVQTWIQIKINVQLF